MALKIEDIPFFKGLSEPELKAVRECIREKSFEKGESLFFEGSICERVFFVRSGRVKLVRASSNGREQTLQTLEPGDTCACNPTSSAWQCSSTAVAMSPCSAWFLSRENYIRLVQSNSKLALALNRLFAERLQCYSALIEEVSLKDSRKRLVRFLLDMLAQNKGEKTLTVPFTREEIAHRIGTARETVARQLHQLKAKKVIDLHPRQIVIRDKAALEKLSQ